MGSKYEFITKYRGELRITALRDYFLTNRKLSVFLMKFRISNELARNFRTNGTVQENAPR
jgi:hypothetical protein